MFKLYYPLNNIKRFHCCDKFWSVNIWKGSVTALLVFVSTASLHGLAGNFHNRSAQSQTQPYNLLMVKLTLTKVFQVYQRKRCKNLEPKNVFLIYFTLICLSPTIFFYLFRIVRSARRSTQPAPLPSPRWRGPRAPPPSPPPTP